MSKYALEYVATGKNYEIADHWSDNGWASSELITFALGKFDPVGRVGWSATADLVNTGALNEAEDQEKERIARKNAVINRVRNYEHKILYICKTPGHYWAAVKYNSQFTLVANINTSTKAWEIMHNEEFIDQINNMQAIVEILSEDQ